MKTSNLPPIPNDLESEMGIIGCCLTDGLEAIAEVQSSCATPSDLFHDLRCREVWHRLLLLVDNGRQIHVRELQRIRHTEDVEPTYFEDLAAASIIPVLLPSYLQTAVEFAQRRAVLEMGRSLVTMAANTSKPIGDAVASMKNASAAIQWKSDKDSAVDFIAKLAERIYVADPARKRPEPRFSIANIPAISAGNLTAISAQAKAGKTALIGAIIASTYAVAGSDCLGIRSSNPDGHAVILIDTEQEPFDHGDLMERSVRRAGISKPPAWLRSYCLTGFTAVDVRYSIRVVLEQAKIDFGGVHSLFIDGIADACVDVNDPAETNALVAELHGLAIEFSCPLICVIHLNPASDFKTRGHLGSQLERKSECNLRLEKDGDTTVVFADKNRRAPISKESGPRFQWSTAAGMHVSIESQASTADREEKEKLMDFADCVFKDRPAMHYHELVSTVLAVGKIQQRGAEKKVAKMIKLNVISKSAANLYTKAT